MFLFSLLFITQGSNTIDKASRKLKRNSATFFELLTLQRTHIMILWSHHDLGHKNIDIL